MSVSVVDRFESKRAADFYREVVEPLAELDVRVDGVRHDVDAGELRADIHLPSRDSSLRTTALELLNAFEEAHGYTVAVLPSILFPEDDTEG